MSHLGRALESLRPCDEVLVVNHGYQEENLKVAREHGARIIKGVNGVDHGAYIQDARHDWIFCLLPTESVAEELEASLLEWKHSETTQDLLGYNIRIREQNGIEWKLLNDELRLANRKKISWTGDCPPEAPNAPLLLGHILRMPDAE
ncbi:MAG TPA: hypothetical protein VKY85_11065 [Candidatus Angelobacter sp.]|nr:hypothetical protein [Candidatus Angelobacter sp.]